MAAKPDVYSTGETIAVIVALLVLGALFGLGGRFLLHLDGWLPEMVGCCFLAVAGYLAAQIVVVIVQCRYRIKGADC